MVSGLQPRYWPKAAVPRTRAPYRRYNFLNITRRLPHQWRYWRNPRAGDHFPTIGIAPGTIAVVAGVVAHFAAKVPGLSGVLIDERIVQINPVVADRSVGLHFQG